MSDASALTELTCMNCRAVTPSAEAKFFASVYLCADCHAQAQHFWDRLCSDLRHLQTMAQESIRLALVTGKFHFPEAGEQPSRRAVLETILAMEEVRACKAMATPSTMDRLSTVSTPQNAPSRGAQG